jgi:peptide deformylase
MAIREIRTMGDEVLAKTCKEVKFMTPRTLILIEDMLDTMYEAMGVGLAAPQVTYMMHALKEHGFNVDTNATTISEAVETISEALDNR